MRGRTIRIPFERLSERLLRLLEIAVLVGEEAQSAVCGHKARIAFERLLVKRSSFCLVSLLLPIAGMEAAFLRGHRGLRLFGRLRGWLGFAVPLLEGILGVRDDLLALSGTKRQCDLQIATFGGGKGNLLGERTVRAHVYRPIVRDLVSDPEHNPSTGVRTRRVASDPDRVG